MKRFLTLTLSALLLLGLLSACGGGETVSVESVGLITGYGSAGVVNRYAGVVASGRTAEIKKDSTQTVRDVLVEVGDLVQEGDVLFTYDTDALELSITKLQLELEGYQNSIATAQEDIPKLENQRANASPSQQLGYTLQIQTLQADIREAEYNMALKQQELEKAQALMENTDVTSPLTGRIMSVNDGSQTSVDPYGYAEQGSGAFITVMDMTTFRVEGKINEMNVGTLYEGMRVIIRSRLDESTLWTGTLESIDWENPASGNDNPNYYYGPVDSSTTASKYPFYVALDSAEGLILGQHVYVEPDFGQTGERSGLWLPEWYISDADSSPWVWCANSRDKLEKRSLTLGGYDAELCVWEILSGLTAEDYIAFPAEGITAGMGAARYSEATFQGGGGEVPDVHFENFGSGGDDIYGGVPMPEVSVPAAFPETANAEDAPAEETAAEAEG